ncbi:MAG TPA: phage holin family protein [Streptosporangiaceae bacterium]|nr:phage holin family protein [Streptosporangiaceae bacterium]
MAEPAVKRTSSNMTDQSIGDLVSVAARDISQLVRYELDLAKLELKHDAKRVGIGAGLLGVALFAACLVLMLLCFAFAYGLNALGIWLWASFLIVAGTCLLLIALAALVAYRMVTKLDGMSKTRRSVSDGLSMLRRKKSPPIQANAEAKADST